MKLLLQILKTVAKPTLAGVVWLSLLPFMVAPVYGQQNGFVVEPHVIRLPAETVTAEIRLGFLSEAVPWTATVAGDWLIVEPNIGEGPATLSLVCQPNTGPARIGHLVFQSPVEGVTPLVVEVWQNQGLDPLGIEALWHQVENPVVDPLTIPPTGSVTLHYLPWEQNMFLNIIGRHPETKIPAWLVRNVFIPDLSHMADLQNLWLPVDLGLLGYERGQPVELMEYAWVVSAEPDTMMPVYPGQTWLISPVAPLEMSATGRQGLLPFTGEPVTDYYSTLIRPFGIDDLVYIGCDMPNGDLDDGARPGEIDGCGPAAAANSLSWLDKHHDDIDIPDNWLDAFNQMSSLMRNRGEGTMDPDFIRAKLDFIEMYDLPIKVKYQDDELEGDIKSSSGNSSAKCHDAKKGDMPTKEWMISEAEDDEDVEVGMTYPNGGGHWVVLTGTVTLNGKTHLFYKDDKKQRVAGGNDQGYTPIKETPGGMVLPGISNAKVDIVVSESYDTDHKPLPDTVSFNRYCQSFKRTLPPGASITLDYPNNPGRCFNTTVRVLNHGEKKGLQVKSVWNHNSGKQRTYVNDTGEPVTVEFHNDDHYDGGVPLLKSYAPFEVALVKSFDSGGQVTDPDNEETYAGFSIGTDDDSGEEFGAVGSAQAAFHMAVGSYFSDFPARMYPGGCTDIRITHPIHTLNRYWNRLGLIIGVYRVDAPGNLTFTSVATGVTGTLYISSPGDYRMDLGGVAADGLFDLQLVSDGTLSLEFDNVGVPSLVQVEPILNLSVSDITLHADSTGQVTFEITNTGGTDMDWSILSYPDWLTVDPLTGTNDQMVVVGFSPNPGAARKDTLWVEAAGARNSPGWIAVSQPASTSGVSWDATSKATAAIFPNPVTDRLNIHFKQLSPGSVSIRILDLMGRTVWQKRVDAADPDLQVEADLAGWTNGAYLIQLDLPDGQTIKRLISKMVR